MKTCITMIVIALCIVGASLWYMITADQNKEAMGIEYCWDEVGNHYVAPDARCYR